MLATPSLLAYYVSTPFHQDYFKRFVYERAKRFGSGNCETEYAPDLPAVSEDAVLLAKDRKVFIDQICIAFKKLKKDRVKIDLYLLELDPDVPYSLIFSKKDMNNGIRLGDTRFSLISANDKMLKLRRLKSYQTR